jgi:hypothetical protein
MKIFAKVAASLYQLTSKKIKKKKVPMPKKLIEAFDSLESALCSEPVVAYLTSNRTFTLIVDAATGSEEEKGGCQLEMQVAC